MWTVLFFFAKAGVRHDNAWSNTIIAVAMHEQWRLRMALAEIEAQCISSAAFCQG